MFALFCVLTVGALLGLFAIGCIILIFNDKDGASAALILMFVTSMLNTGLYFAQSDLKAYAQISEQTSSLLKTCEQDLPRNIKCVLTATPETIKEIVNDN